MGGCKCSYRKCSNSSQSHPGLHFFHYPVKYPERLEQWMKNAGTCHFAQLPTSKVKNKVVCQEHFEKKCFMNHKRDSLTKLAVPMEYKGQDQDQYLDTSASEGAEAEQIIKSADKATHELWNLDIDIRKKKVTPNPISEAPGKEDEDASSTARDIKSEPCPQKLPVFGSKRNTKILQDPPANINIPRKRVKRVKEPQVNVEEFLRVKAFQSTHSETWVKTAAKGTQTEKEIKNPKPPPTPLQQAKKQLPMDKRSLFNAIKKHINPVMATLLGMELFSSADHDWEVEEKELAMEMHEQGEDVYKYLRDELRFRLPAVADVEKWKKENEGA